MSDFKRIPPKRNATDDPKLALHGEPWREGDYSKKPSFKLRVIDSSDKKQTDGKPTSVGVWITVYLNHPDENDDAKKIDLKMDSAMAASFLTIVERHIADPDLPMEGIDTIGYSFNGGVRADKPSSQGSALVGRNGDGAVCIVVKQGSRPPAMFAFTPTFWWNLIDKSGNNLSAATASEIVATGWVKKVNDTITLVSNDVYNAKEAARLKSEAGGNAGGAQQNSYQKKSYGNESGAKKSWGSNNKASSAAATADVFDTMH